MLIRAGYRIAFYHPAPTPLLLKLYTHPSRRESLRRPDFARVEPAVPVEQFLDEFGNRCGRILAPAGRIELWNETIVADSGLPDPVCPDAYQHPVEELPPRVLPFLMNSRYCEVDLLTDRAWELFAGTPLGWGRVQAICDWVHGHVQFGYHHARKTRTALETFQEGEGVCRDFQHLAVTFCRCMNIPARYATGYLGDIGVPPLPGPMDFSAWFEAYLDGRWWAFDARHNTPRIGRILMATGRDATDVALTTAFGESRLEHFEVWTDAMDELPVPDAEEPEEEDEPALAWAA